ncbi:MAG TPA: LacI family DNA-binding transcriptional regulator [Marisediminicola sp.]|jgi:LacI family transcriptional regulator|nr:LacI family DNA-binding transcriptional regulator [Marisediminicola sp.]
MSRRPRERNETASVTVKTVAERAGVSVATVSRVLRGQMQTVTEKTRERVFAAARELNYTPHPVAVALRTGTSKILGLVIPDISDTYFHQVARGVEDVAQQAGYSVIFCNTDRNIEKESRTLDLLREKRVDGIIFCGGGVGGEAHLVGRDWSSAKVVAIGAHVIDLPSVKVDDASAIDAAVEHLAASGRQRILCIAGNVDWLVTERRVAGYKSAVERLGLVSQPELLSYAGFTSDDGRRAVERALASGVEFDAIIAFEDNAALGALGALREAGLDVPGDVSLMGCDDIPTGGLTTPTLSSIHWPTYDMGAAAARLVLDAIEGKPTPSGLEFPFELQIRESTTRSPAV